MILKICFKIVPKVSSENDECIEVALSRSWTPDRTNYEFFPKSMMLDKGSLVGISHEHPSVVNFQRSVETPKLY